MKPKRYISYFIAFVCIISLTLNTQGVFAEGNKDFRVVGYYSEIFDDPIDERVQFDKLTHITYAFLIPGEDGSLIGIEKPEKLKELVAKSHKNDVEVLIAVGGWSYQNIPLDPTFEKLAASDEARAKFVESVLKFVEDYDFDGVEIDWEYPDEGISSQNYEKLVLELSKALKAEGKYLTAALNGAWSKTEGPSVSRAVTDPCLKAFDWINIMAYDMNNEQHSPLWFAETSIQYWLHRNVPKEKIVLGVPFYAKPSWKQYRHLVAEDRGNAYMDYAKGEPFDSYYNGIHTIRAKTKVALQYASGIMIFDINEDTTDELSLLKVINDTKNEFFSSTFAGFQDIYFILNGQPLAFVEDDGLGVPFVDENNRTMVPVRKALESIGAAVRFEENPSTVIAEKEGITLEIPIDKNYIIVDGRRMDLDTKAVIRDGRSYVPLRYLFEAFGYGVTWHNESKTVMIQRP
ncbi:GH18 family chitinase [Anaerosolibacter carboniphilus]|uniref:chitinase n=1 Tax=Anaerosolibacter carboniphilus TaxID=1417629 RepID=A0A841KPB6_9FIRM|nr:glycosyl hydrolase family 18 protein [Anaerosolibacter carboniphilus]MBB6215306.1 GH18 family chitinase [Anaerosolibacter carboniphilus]